MNSVSMHCRLLLVLLQITSQCAAENLTYMRIDQSVLDKRLIRMPSDLPDRLSILHSQFRSAGCKEPIVEEEVAGSVIPNVLCTLPGSDTGTLVIAAQLDYKSHGDEEGVQWATLGLLPLLAESLNASVRRHTLIFAALSGGNDEFAGARRFLALLNPAERKNLLGVIYLDHLGRVPPAYAHSFTYRAAKIVAGTLVTATVATSENVLTANVGTAAQILNVSSPAAIDGILPTGTAVFHDAGIPSINFHSLSYSTMVGIGQTETHQLRTAVDPAVYGDTYNFLCIYVLAVDKMLGGERGASRDAESEGSSPTHP